MSPFLQARSANLAKAMIYSMLGKSLLVAGRRLSVTTSSANAKALLPIIDVSPWVSALQRNADFVHEGVAKQLDHAFSEYGFAVVVGHGVNDTQYDVLYETAKSFFRSDSAKKREYDLNQGYGFGGYLSVGNEAGGQLMGDANTEGQSDIVESLTCRGLQHFMSPAGHSTSNTTSERKPCVPHFAQDMSETPSADHIPPELLLPTLAVHNALLPFKTMLTRTTERVMGVKLGAFQEAFDPLRGGIRFAYYPELETFSADEQPVGYGAHADSGGMVVLRLDRDNPVGTEVLYQGQWIPVPVDIPNAVVLNGGTILQRLTGGRWRAAIHRAVRANRQERLSIVYGAMVPQNDLEISSLAVTDLGKAIEGQKVVRVKDYLDARVRMQRPETNPRDQELVAFVDGMA